MNKVRLHRQEYGPGQRLSYQEEILKDKPIVPNPVEYEDIDTEYYKFFDNAINLTDDDGKKMPTFTLYSNQRFSEYSQTWKHTDDDGNLLMNFKTVNRENNPNFGTIQGGNYNIPNRRFTIRIREVKDENGIDCYEITSMSQPIQTDLMYRLSFVTSKYEKLNDFNVEINKLFASKQCYLCVNGHYMPMTLENISDETSYSIEDRKFFVQTASMKLLGYVIPKDDIKVELKPKRHKVNLDIEKTKLTKVSFDYITDEEIEFKVEFGPGVSKVKFTSEDNMILKCESIENAKKIVFEVNGEEVGIENKFRIMKDDEVNVKIFQPKQGKKSILTFSGILT